VFDYVDGPDFRGVFVGVRQLPNVSQDIRLAEQVDVLEVLKGTVAAP
jgi:hypothetical protein